MVDGTAILMTMMWGLKQIGFWDEAHRHRTCSTPARRSTTPTRPTDGKFVSLGSLEPQFYAELIQRLGLEGEDLPRADGPRRLGHAARHASPTLFKTKTRDEWDAILAGSDACYAPVLTMTRGDERRAHQGAQHDHRARRRAAARARAALLAHRGRGAALDAPWPGQHTDEALADWGVAAAEIAKLRETGAIA